MTTLMIGASAFGKACRRMIVDGRQALEFGRLDIGRLHDVEDRGAGHAHHVGEARRSVSASAGSAIACMRSHEGHAVIDGGDAREPLQLHGEEVDEHVADEEFGKRGRGEREARDQLVDPAVAIAHGDQAEDDRQRHGTIAAQKARNSVFQSRPPSDVAMSCRLVSAVPRSPVSTPPSQLEIADIGRIVEAELLAQIGERLRRRRWPRIDWATSPGRICVPAKIRTETANRRRMPSAMRWATSFTMGDDICAGPDQASSQHFAKA